MAFAEISSDPKVMLGRPVIAGTRITVELLLERLAAGETVEQIERAFPHLPANSIPAALRYAAAVIANEQIRPLHQIST